MFEVFVSIAQTRADVEVAADRDNERPHFVDISVSDLSRACVDIDSSSEFLWVCRIEFACVFGLPDELLVVVVRDCVCVVRASRVVRVGRG